MSAQLLSPTFRVLRSPILFERSMSFVCMVRISGVAQSEGKLAAFVEGEIRGVQDTSLAIPAGPHSGKHMFDLHVYSTPIGEAEVAGEAITFVFFMGVHVVPLMPTKTFVANAVRGSFISPVMLDGISPPFPPPLPPAAPPPPKPLPLPEEWTIR